MLYASTGGQPACDVLTEGDKVDSELGRQTGRIFSEAIVTRDQRYRAVTIRSGYDRQPVCYEAHIYKSLRFNILRELQCVNC